MRGAKLLSGYKQALASTDIEAPEDAEAASDLPPTVEAGSSYGTLKDLESGGGALSA